MLTGIESTLVDLLLGCLDALDVEAVNRVEGALNITFVLGVGDLDQYFEGGRPKVKAVANLREKLISFTKEPSYNGERTPSVQKRNDYLTAYASPVHI